MNKDRLLSDEELKIEIGKCIHFEDYDAMLDLINTQKRLYAESLRSKDPHKCEFGHEVYFHKTVDGWCCACDADQAFMESEIEKKARIK